jgi:hypothetical protein
MTPGAGEAWCVLFPGGERPEVCITPGVQFCLTPGAGKARCVLLWVWGERERGGEVCVTWSNPTICCHNFKICLGHVLDNILAEFRSHVGPYFKISLGHFVGQFF